MNYCKNCGAQLAENSNFCTKCGAKIEEISNANSQYCFTLECIENIKLTFNYIYLLFYTDKVIVVQVTGKQMDKDIYAALKVLKKQKKMKLSEQMEYRTTHLKNFSSKLSSMSGDELLAINKKNLIIYANDIQEAEFLFMSKKTYVGEEDAHTSTTRGYVKLNASGKKIKYYHNYGYHEKTYHLMRNALGGMFKIYK